MPMPDPGTLPWTAWHLEHTFKPDDAAIIQYICTWPSRSARVLEYAQACHMRGWAGWQATLAWNVIETITQPLQDKEDDIPF
jgi:hypothetical protein